MTSFADLGLSGIALQAVERLGYEKPTPIQEQAIPLVLEGKDLIAAAKTGTGKTAAFSLPSLDGLGRAKRAKAPLMLVITPTRELAMQIADVCSAISAGSKHRIATVVGGVAVNPQISRLAKGVDVLIATPGRLIDLMNQRAVDLSGVEKLVLDEADRMLDMGFLPSVTRIVDATPKTRQTLLFSATVDKSIMGQVGSMLNDPALVQIAVKGETADTVEQYIAEVPHALKPAMLTALLSEHGAQRVIVFARTRHRADSCCRKLKRAGFSAEAIHSDRSQNQRKRALDNFAAGTTDILVATDVLARGIDVEEVSYVVNFDIPVQAEDYVHRIGRTGRAGAAGFAVTFVSPENASELAAIEKFIKKSIPKMDVAGFDLEAAAEQAAARATAAAAKRDPELAEAARELARKNKKKEQAREQARNEEESRGKGGKGKSSRGKRNEASGDSAQGKRKASRNEKPGTRTAKPKGSNAGKSTRGAEQKPKKPGNRGKRASKPAGQKGSARDTSRAGSDMRPGRAHRAALAEQRHRTKRGR